jgi:hypothetical protein
VAAREAAEGGGGGGGVVEGSETANRARGGLQLPIHSPMIYLSFLQRHPDLKSMISSPRSVNHIYCIVAQDRGTFIRWYLFVGGEISRSRR